MDIIHYPNLSLSIAGDSWLSCCESVELHYSANQLHHMITFTFTMKNSSVIPEISYDTPVQINVSLSPHGASPSVVFVLLETTQTDYGVSVRGYSDSILFDKPFVNPQTYTLTEDTDVIDIVSGLLNCVWNLPSWIMRKNWTIEDTPIGIVLALVQMVRGVLVYDHANRKFIAQPKYLTRPHNTFNNPQIQYEPRRHLLDISQTRSIGTYYDCILVEGELDKTQAPLIMVDKNCSPNVESPVLINVYWGNLTPIKHFVVSTLGNISIAHSRTEYVEEVVVFINGEASVSRPITSIQKTEWIGRHAEYTWVPNERKLQLVLDDLDFEQQIAEDNETPEMVVQKYAVAKICYKASFTQYEVTAKEAGAFIFILKYYYNGLSLFLYTKTTDNPAPVQSVSTLTSSEALVQLGTAALDENRFDKITYTITVPYLIDLHINDIIQIARSDVSPALLLCVEDITVIISEGVVLHKLSAYTWENVKG